MDKGTPAPTVTVILLLAVSGLLYGVLSLKSHSEFSIVSFSVLLLLYGIFLWAIILRRHLGKIHIAVFICAALLFRLVMFMSEPKLLSDDVYRYLWDSMVQAGGTNPYVFPPAHEALGELQGSDIYPLVNHPWYKTIYPPLAQGIFLIAYITGGESLASLRIIYLLFEVLAFLFLTGISRDREVQALYLICPLIAVEGYLGMHIDIIGMSFLLGGVFFVRKKKWPLAFLFLLFSIQVKYLTAVCAPVFFLEYMKYENSRHGSVRSWVMTSFSGILFILGFLSFYIPFADAGPSLYEQFFIYNRQWEFNSSIFHLVDLIIETDSRVIVVFILLTIEMVIYFIPRISFQDRVVLSLMALFLCTHTLYPWYLLWIVPLILMNTRAGEIYLLLIISISYSVILNYDKTGAWELRPVIRVIEYVPFYILFILDLVKRQYVQGEKSSSNHTGP